MRMSISDNEVQRALRIIVDWADVCMPPSTRSWIGVVVTMRQCAEAPL